MNVRSALHSRRRLPFAFGVVLVLLAAIVAGFSRSPESVANPTVAEIIGVADSVDNALLDEREDESNSAGAPEPNSVGDGFSEDSSAGIVEPVADKPKRGYEHPVLPEMNWIQGPENFALRGAWTSPDGRCIAYFGGVKEKMRSDSIVIMDVSSETRLADIVSQSEPGLGRLDSKAAWSPDSRRLAYVDLVYTVPHTHDGNGAAGQRSNTLEHIHSRHMIVSEFDLASSTVSDLLTLNYDDGLVLGVGYRDDGSVLAAVVPSRNRNELGIVVIQDDVVAERLHFELNDVEAVFPLTGSRMGYSRVVSEGAGASPVREFGYLNVDGSGEVVPIREGSGAVGWSGDGEYALCQSAINSYAVLDVATGEISAFHYPANLPKLFGLNHDGSRAYIVGAEDGTVEGSVLYSGGIGFELGLFEFDWRAYSDRVADL